MSYLSLIVSKPKRIYVLSKMYDVVGSVAYFVCTVNQRMLHHLVSSFPDFMLGGWGGEWELEHKELKVYNEHLPRESFIDVKRKH